MKLCTPEISWHDRDPIYSIDFQYHGGQITRMVTSGTDKNIRIWSIADGKDGKVNIEFLSNLDRHSRAVNVVRFSPDGQLLASAGDDSVIMLWKLQSAGLQPGATLFDGDEGEANNKETWTVQKVLRGHLEDIYDLCWSSDSTKIISGSVDNSAIVWDVKKGKSMAILKESSSFVQGVAWDPKNQYFATLSCDRRLRIYNVATQQCLHSVHKMSLPCQPAESGGEPQKPRVFRMFHDDTMKSFFRRLAFSPDGEVLVTPAGVVELEKEKNDDVIITDDVTTVKDTKEVKSEVNATFLFSRTKLTKPAAYLPYGPKATVAVRCCPVLFQLREVARKQKPAAADLENLKPWEKYETMFCLPYRVVFAVATEESVLIYDTQQTSPIVCINKIHYHQLSDLAWSSDGRTLVVASTDGYCSVVSFDENELGQVYTPPRSEQVNNTADETCGSLLTEPSYKSPEPNTTSRTCNEKSGEETMDLHLVLDDSTDEMDTTPADLDQSTASDRVKAPCIDKNMNEQATPSTGTREETCQTKSDLSKPRRIALTTLTRKT